MCHISESNIDINAKEIKKEEIPQANISNVSTIVIDDSSDDMIIHHTSNSEIPQTQKNETKKQPPSPPSTSVKKNENIKQEPEEDEIPLSNSGINVQLPIYSTTPVNI